LREEEEVKDWWDLLAVKGIGDKTVEKMIQFSAEHDPFKARWLDESIAAVKRAIENGELGDLPTPTHRAADLPYKTGVTTEIVWLGSIHTRNVRDIFEYNQAKGAELDVENATINGKKIKDPHLSEFCIMVGDDETDQMGVRLDRWKYPKLRNAVFSIQPGKHLVLVHGFRPHWLPMRNIMATKLWVIDPQI
jgi:hypothetical protein